MLLGTSSSCNYVIFDLSVDTRGQSYKYFMMVNFDSGVVVTINCLYCNFRLITSYFAAFLRMTKSLPKQKYLTNEVLISQVPELLHSYSKLEFKRQFLHNINIISVKTFSTDDIGIQVDKIWIHEILHECHCLYSFCSL